MERLGDDELLCIFDKIPKYSPDRKTFLQVSKRFLKIAGVRLKRFRCSFPVLLFDILPSSPNIITFDCAQELSNTHLKLLAHCPNLRCLDLSRDRDFDPCSDFDFDDDGLCAVANACIHLQTVSLHKRVKVGDTGVAALVTSCKELEALSLEIINITDESLKAITRSGIDVLRLHGCDRITDSGIIHLKQMLHLRTLELGSCGVHITDTGIVLLASQLPNIQSLGLYRLKNITNISLLVIGTECLRLESICFVACESITGQGLHGFSCHPTLRDLQLLRCYNICWEDVKSVALTCRKLAYVEVSRSIMTSIPDEDESLLRIEEIHCLLIGGHYCTIAIMEE